MSTPDTGPVLRAPGIHPPDAPGALDGSAPGAAGSAPGAFEPYTDEEWQRRLRVAMAETLRKAAARRDERAAFKARRDAGLVQRYRQKEARSRARGSRGTGRGRGERMPELPPCCREVEGGVCPQHAQAAEEWPQRTKARTGPAMRVVGPAGTAKPARDTEERP